MSVNVTKGPICDDPYDSDSDSDSDDEEEEFPPPTTPPPTTLPPTTLPPTTPPPELEIEGEVLGEVPAGDGGIIIDGEEEELLLEGGNATVCGTDGISYNSTCEMAKETGEVDVAYRGKCEQDKCQYRLVRLLQ